ncbi:MAG: ABC transporter substrate-binding protein [Myxococcales bacterium]|nr:ABC transporter substrate-binding protein [Myxococcales bacterium]
MSSTTPPSRAATPATRTPIRLGLMAPLTGVVGMYGSEIARAGRLAAREVNQAGGLLGRPLELVVADDGSLPETAVPQAQRLLDEEGCVALVGNLLSNARIAVASRVAAPRRVPYLNFSFYEGSIWSRYFFHFAALPNQQIDKMIPAMATRCGPKMFFAGNDYEWPRGSIDAAKRSLAAAGGEVVGEEYFPLGCSNFDALLQRLARSGADVFVPYAAGTDQRLLLTRFAERGLRGRMAVVMGHYDEAMVSRLPPEVRAGLYSSNTYFMSVDTAENRAVLSGLKELNGGEALWPSGSTLMTNFGEGTYVCVKAFAAAVEATGSTESEALVDALEYSWLSAPQGQVLMDPVTHHAHVNTYLARCRADGSFEIVESFGRIDPRVPDRYRGAELQVAPTVSSAPTLRASTRPRAPQATVLLGTLKVLQGDRCLTQLCPVAPNVVADGPEWAEHTLDWLAHQPSCLQRAAAGALIALDHPECQAPAQLAGWERLLALCFRQDGAAHLGLFARRRGLSEEAPPSTTAENTPGIRAPTVSSHAAVLIVDPQDHLLGFEEGFAQAWRTDSPELLLGLPLGELFADIPEAQALALSAKRWQGQARYCDGSRGLISLHCHRIDDHAGCTLAHVIISTHYGSDASSTAPPPGVANGWAALDLVDTTVIAVDTDGTIMEANDRAALDFGYRSGELTGLAVEQLLPPRSRAQHAEHMRRFFDAPGARLAMQNRTEIHGYRKDGTEFPAEASVQRCDGPDGSYAVLTLHDISDRVSARAQLQYQATHDALTGLPNRKLINERLAAALLRAHRNRDMVGLLFVDLDGFKLVNDGYGHQAGDRLLREVSERLVDAIRPGDVVGRFGGDEFVVVCEQLRDRDQVTAIAERIVEAVKAPVCIDGHELYVSASIGIALGDDPNQTAEALLRDADAAMYRVKARGRDGYQIFDQQTREDSSGRLELIASMRRAIEDRAIDSAFQPIVDPDSGSVVGAEILSRWVHPQHGPIEPERFIPIAEATGLVTRLGDQIFEEACHAELRTRRLPGGPGGLDLTVNLSARELHDPKLAERFGATLRNTGADPSRLTLEITGSVLMDDAPDVVETLENLAALGLSLAIDDFGTGYSSLSFLRRLPIAAVKVDRALVADIDRDPLKRDVLEAVFGIARALRLQVHAAGVQELGELSLLKNLGCERVQGRYLYPPMALESFEKLLSDSGTLPAGAVEGAA